MRHKILLCLLCLSFLISGCDSFPYILYPATETPTSVPTRIQQPTETPQPTATLPENPPLEPTATPGDDSEDDYSLDPAPPEIKYTIQDGGPFYLPNFTHPDQGCQWMGVAGQVFDHDAVEVLGLTIISGNNAKDEENDRSAITGQTTAYGLGGYEIQIENNPIASTQVFWVQVIDSHGQPLSEKIYFDTFDDCEQNLILVNFVTIEDQDTP